VLEPLTLGRWVPHFPVPGFKSSFYRVHFKQDPISRIHADQKVKARLPVGKRMKVVITTIPLAASVLGIYQFLTRKEEEILDRVKKIQQELHQEGKPQN
ncbi:hypothetical protein CCACVL1_09558, partial [Corchorus capsularis]